MRAWREGTMLMQQGAQCSRGRFFASRTLATALHLGFRGLDGESGRETKYIYIFCARRPLRLPPPPPLHFVHIFVASFFPRLPELLTSSPAPSVSYCLLLSLLIVSSKDTTLASISPLLDCDHFLEHPAGSHHRTTPWLPTTGQQSFQILMQISAQLPTSSHGRLRVCLGWCWDFACGASGGSTAASGLMIIC